MSTFEVTSELYAEAEFCSTETGNGHSISKFTFVYPNQRAKEVKGDQTVLKNGYDKQTAADSQSPRPSSRESVADSVEPEEDTEESEFDYDDGECDEESDGTTTATTASPLPIEIDKDGDLIVERQKRGVIEIEHRKSTKLDLVGLQIWRGALLLADYIFHNERKFKQSHILELGSGVGLTSIVASMYAREVICTDIDIGGLLDLIRGNLQRNSHLANPHCRVDVSELDFKVSYQDYPRQLKDRLQHIQYVIAADVIYDDDITEAFVRTIVGLLLKLPKLKAIYIALEKRYVFTLEDMDSVAPCYDYFLNYFQKRNNRFGVNRWKLINVCIDFPRYFDYEKVKDLVLLKICHASK
ncbi:methyltransferase-like protein 22 isoform X2 [Anopheles ziemanni]|uniref:methyltransferase-like protein 22 isoform X2 n=1 Tax=Anopheles coustani TaxID=139045 RepID=UPI00265A7ADB|nr:methyltransferase-like protein 22 isoform X2 [Anopheles coustani]XP_058172331.1 methyltransferase-like protein 22 isoform X2 [Anopheles ziemanni]